MDATIAIHEDSLKHILCFTSRSQVSFQHYIIHVSTFGNARDHNERTRLSYNINE